MAEPNGANNNPNNNEPNANGANGNGTNATGQAPTIDYEKLAGLINGAQAAKEDSVLKSYFKQQGLEANEMQQAIDAYKKQKAENTPDVNAMTQNIETLTTQLQQEQIKNSATIAAVELGIDKSVLPYVIKFSDFSDVMDDKGAIDSEKIKTAINQLLTDVPAFKPQETATGFQVGSGQGNQGNNNSKVSDEIMKIFTGK